MCPKWTSLVRVCSRIEILDEGRGYSITLPAHLLLSSLASLRPGLLLGSLYDTTRLATTVSFRLAFDPARVFLSLQGLSVASVVNSSLYFLWCVAPSEKRDTRLLIHLLQAQHSRLPILLYIPRSALHHSTSVISVAEHRSLPRNGFMEGCCAWRWRCG